METGNKFYIQCVPYIAIEIDNKVITRRLYNEDKETKTGTIRNRGKIVKVAYR